MNLVVEWMLVAGGARAAWAGQAEGQERPPAGPTATKAPDTADTAGREGSELPSNSTQDWPGTSMDPPGLVFLCLAVSLMTMMILMGTAGNILVIIAVKTHKKLQTESNFFVVNLSICDLLFVTMVLPFNIYSYVEDGWKLDSQLCQMVGFLGYALTGTTLLNITLIAWNRYKLVTDMANYKIIFSRSNILIMIFATWLLPVIFLLPTVSERLGKFGYVAMLVTCNLLLNQTSQSFKIFLLFVRALVPCILIAYFYSVIYNVTQTSHRKIRRNVSNLTTHQLSMHKHDVKLTRTMAIIFLVFVVSYFPCAVTGIIDWNSVLSKNYHMFCEITIYIGSALNPVIYGLMNSQFRAAYCNLLCRARLMLDTERRGLRKRFSVKQLTTSIDAMAYRIGHRHCGSGSGYAQDTRNKPLLLASKLTRVAPVSLSTIHMPPGNIVTQPPATTHS